MSVLNNNVLNLFWFRFLVACFELYFQQDLDGDIDKVKLKKPWWTWYGDIAAKMTNDGIHMVWKSVSGREKMFTGQQPIASLLNLWCCPICGRRGDWGECQQF